MALQAQTKAPASCNLTTVSTIDMPPELTKPANSSYQAHTLAPALSGYHPDCAANGFNLELRALIEPKLECPDAVALPIKIAVETGRSPSCP
jgi:hypothetical protein